jgi:hypothetical protein
MQQGDGKYFGVVQMTDQMLVEPVELTPEELNIVSGGITQTQLNNLVGVQANVLNILNNNDVDVAVAANVIGQSAFAHA